MIREFESLAESVNNPAKKDLSSFPSTVSLEKFLKRKCLKAFVRANVRSGEDLINGVIEVATECTHALATALAQLEEVVHKNVGQAQRALQGTIRRGSPLQERRVVDRRRSIAGRS